jgi:hypothetical protein
MYPLVKLQNIKKEERGGSGSLVDADYGKWQQHETISGQILVASSI